MKSISYRIESQLNKKVSKVTLRKASLFFLEVQRNPISLLEATVILNLRAATVLQKIIQLPKNPCSFWQ